MARILHLSPWNGGSHAAFTRVMTDGVDADWTTIGLPGRHWTWRMRGFVPWLIQANADTLNETWDAIFATSYVALHELRGLAPQLAHTPALLYFHENQYAYPTRGKGPGYAFGFTQLLSACAADQVWFNSEWNRDAFFDGVRGHFKRLPDHKPHGLLERVVEKSHVVGVPLLLPDTPVAERTQGPLRILWNHRWEHDKAPERFFDALFDLAKEGADFEVIVCGASFLKVPDIFEQAKQALSGRIVHWGFADSRADYLRLLDLSDVVVSTADHEFFGISVLEATHAGVYPLVPDRLSYPELFPEEFRFATPQDLVGRLRAMCADPTRSRSDRRHLTQPHGTERIADIQRRLDHWLAPMA
ncbi:MAG: DUF3524 domain-containing protein [Rhodobacterales bacterium]|nr:DUF3524 domain-containing protein [Rhodobacterales bacterium]